MVVYKISNTINDKIYIGMTTNSVKQRFIEHKSSCKTKVTNTPLYNAMRKHGIDNFIIEPLAYCDTEYDLNFLEQAFIKKFDTINNGYNIKEGGNGGKWSDTAKKRVIGKKYSDERKLNISLAQKERFSNMSEEEIVRHRNINLGRKHTDETKAKVSLSGIGKKRSYETKLNLSNSNMYKGKSMPKELVDKMRFSKKTKWVCKQLLLYADKLSK